MYISGGFNCYPAEIEQQLLQHSAVAQAAIVGIDEARLGEVGVAFVVPIGSDHPSEAELYSWCRDQMANYKVPRHVFWRDSLPVNATGKVLKTELRQLAATLLN